MLQVTERLQESPTPQGHILSSRGGVVVQVEYNPKEEHIEELPPVKIKEIEGKCGTITVMKPSREVKETDEDIHSLIAKVLLMKQKRLQATGE
ncbi:hypothetical protein KGF86_01855 [Ornithinibacillus massiliensis]|uniref:Uncharacterized protein n=1 Tax=Ornithinibacillus massiliensis TaxID=1944633 RepID=A0ABS5M9G7_9BACI|nr:hypothetical protein [Ornithinibacillus massiliensis]MBS3678949.1 hypothetical protein [Ornithinibacillus massiliensis]